MNSHKFVMHIKMSLYGITSMAKLSCLRISTTLLQNRFCESYLLGWPRVEWGGCPWLFICWRTGVPCPSREPRRWTISFLFTAKTNSCWRNSLTSRGRLPLTCYLEEMFKWQVEFWMVSWDSYRVTPHLMQQSKMILQHCTRWEHVQE